MHKRDLIHYFDEKLDFDLTGDIKLDVEQLLSKNHESTLEHVNKVAIYGIRLANQFGVSKEKVEIACLLHDISAIVPNERRIELTKKSNLELIEEEKLVPMLLHQKNSQTIAEYYFNIKDKGILSAIGYHTTLKKNPSKLDMIVFIADKIAWDQDGEPPYLYSVEEGLKESLEKGTFSYINYLMSNKKTLKVLHPYLEEAYGWFIERLK